MKAADILWMTLEEKQVRLKTNNEKEKVITFF